MLNRMPASARWRRAARDTTGPRRWVRRTSLGVVAAAAAWLMPWPSGIVPTPRVGGVPPEVLLPLAGFIVTVLAAPLLEFAWHYWRAPSRLTDALERRMSALEQARMAEPVARLRFDYNSKTQQALLHVTNYGGEAEFWGLLTIDGELSGRLENTVSAAWEHTGGVKSPIATGETRTLYLAQLDLSTFPFAQWQVYVIGADGSRCALRAMHTSVVGGAPDTFASTIFLEVSLLSTPEFAERIRTCTIALYPFDAQRLRP